MADAEFIIGSRLLASGVYLAEALGSAELSAIGSAPEVAREILRRKLKDFLTEDSGTLGLHRRRVGAGATLGKIHVRLQAPSRSAAWREAVPLPVHYLRWSERDDFHVAYAPGLNVMVFAAELEDLPGRLEKNLRLVLSRQKDRYNLFQLSRADAVEAIELGTAQVELTPKTPKQLALAEETQKDEAETLKKVASPLGDIADPQAFELDEELRSLGEMLQGEARRSALLVGAPGSGKTALVREFARRRSEFLFGGTTFWTTTGSRLMTGPIGYGMWQQRCQSMCRELAKTNAILHVGNLAELVEVGKSRRGEQSVGGFLRPWIARGEVQFIAEITPHDLGRLERQEPQLVAAFQQVTIAPRTNDQTSRILEKIWSGAPGERNTTLETRESNRALKRLQALHERYGVYSARPGRAVRFLRNLLSDEFPKRVLTQGAVTARFSRETGIPETLLDDRVPMDLAAIEQWFAGHVIGQTEATTRVVDVIATVKARLVRPAKPIASLLFIGPTGVGKTEMAKALAEFFFGKIDRMTRFDLNQFNDPVSVMRLIGGAGAQEGLLTARIREQPFSLVLLDEFEKADPSFFDLLLQILGEGRLTDAAGRLADFSNCVIVMTSNLGAECFQRGTPGFRQSPRDADKANVHFEDAVAKFLRPEIFNRLDAIIPFEPLPAEIIRSIAERYVTTIRQRHGITQRRIDLHIEPETIEHLARKGLNPKYGARPLKRAVEQELVVSLAEELATKVDGRGVVAGVRGTQIKVWKTAAPAQPGPNNEPSARSAEAVVEVRRGMTRLKASTAYSSLENQITSLRDLEGRLNKAKWKSPEDLQRIERLPMLRRVAEDVEKLVNDVQALEIEILQNLYRRQPEAAPLRAKTTPMTALSEAKVRKRQHQFRIYEAFFDRSNELIFGLYSEDKLLLTEMIVAYRSLSEKNGEISELIYFVPATRSKGTKSATGYTREKAKDFKELFAVPSGTLLGVAMTCRGYLFAPKFMDEAGLHSFRKEKEARLALVETATGAMKDYQPPRGFELQGFIHAKSAAVRRTFFMLENKVNDLFLGERPWNGPRIERCLEELLEENLTRKVMAATGGE